MRRTGLVVIGLTLAAIAAAPAAGQEDFDKGKSPAQLFKSDCAICHDSPQGLGAAMGPGALTSFLTEHYTASRTVADALAAYLVSAQKGQRDEPRRHKRPNRNNSAAPDNDAAPQETSAAGRRPR